MLRDVASEWLCTIQQWELLWNSGENAETLYVQAFVPLHQGKWEEEGNESEDMLLQTLTPPPELAVPISLPLCQYIDTFPRLPFLSSPSSRHWGSGSKENEAMRS